MEAKAVGIERQIAAFAVFPVGQHVARHGAVAALVLMGIRPVRVPVHNGIERGVVCKSSLHAAMHRVQNSAIIRINKI